MLKPKYFALASVVVLAASLAASDAWAGYYGRGGYHGPRPGRARWGYRHRPHVYAGGQIEGLAIAGEVTDYTDGYIDHGGGVGLFVGGRISPFFSIEGDWHITYHNERFEYTDATVVDIDSLYLMTFEVDGKLHVPTMGPVEPYFQAGIGFSFLGATYDVGSGDSVFASGPSFNIGGGLDFWISPWLTVGGRLLYRGMYFGEPHYDGGDRYTNFVNGISLDLNGAFHF